MAGGECWVDASSLFSPICPWLGGRRQYSPIRDCNFTFVFTTQDDPSPNPIDIILLNISSVYLFPTKILAMVFTSSFQHGETGHITSVLSLTWHQGKVRDYNGRAEEGVLHLGSWALGCCCRPHLWAPPSSSPECFGCILEEPGVSSELRPPTCVLILSFLCTVSLLVRQKAPGKTTYAESKLLSLASNSDLDLVDWPR